VAISSSSPSRRSVSSSPLVWCWTKATGSSRDQASRWRYAPAPQTDISTIDALRNTLLQAKSIGYSASESGKYLTTELVQRWHRRSVLPKSRLIGGGERVGAVIARGELDIGFQQISELRPVPGIAHITPLPPEVQKVSSFAAGVAASSPTRPARAR